ncbi:MULTISPECIES: hypothetical protein [Okeania]|nr:MULTISPECIES: hypothetical protein [Okeania]
MIKSLLVGVGDRRQETGGMGIIEEVGRRVVRRLFCFFCPQY